MTNLKYEVGTRYSNSKIYDAATDEVIHGWQVFEQFREDCTPTGRKSFINNSGVLCGILIAERMREEAITKSANDLLEALKLCVALVANGNEQGDEAIAAATAVIEKAEGIK